MPQRQKRLSELLHKTECYCEEEEQWLYSHRNLKSRKEREVAQEKILNNLSNRFKTKPEIDLRKLYKKRRLHRSLKERENEEAGQGKIQLRAKGIHWLNRRLLKKSKQK